MLHNMYLLYNLRYSTLQGKGQPLYDGLTMRELAQNVLYLEVSL